MTQTKLHFPWGVSEIYGHGEMLTSEPLTKAICLWQAFLENAEFQAYVSQLQVVYDDIMDKVDCQGQQSHLHSLDKA